MNLIFKIITLTEKCVHYYPSLSVFPIPIFLNHFIDLTNFLEKNAIALLRFCLDWLIDYLQLYVPLKNISLIWRRHHCRWRAAEFRPMLSSKGPWAGRNLYSLTCHTYCDTGLRFFRPNQSPLTIRIAMRRTYSNPDQVSLQYIRNMLETTSFRIPFTR
jgi:hypothetical protein